MLLILYFWILLIENGTNWLGILFDFGNGFEIRFSLILKVIFLILNITLLIISKQKSKKIKFLLYFMLFLLTSTLYVGITKPQYFEQAISVNFHIQLVLNIIIYIYWAKLEEIEIIRFFNWLRFFGLFNAILVIISFFFPTLTSFFEAGTSNVGITRAFGIMGDEVSIFLTFFIFDSLIFKQRVKTVIYSIALLCTGSIGAFFIFLILLGYYLFYIVKVSKKYIIHISIVSVLIIFGIFNFSSKIQEITVIKRVFNNIQNPEIETGNFRLISFSTAIEMSKERPVLGAGYGAYASLVKQKYGYLTQGGNVSMNILGSTYNPYLQMICEAGFIGLLFFIILLRRFLRVCKLNADPLNDFLTKFKTVSYGWLFIFCLTCLSANWFLPVSFLFLLIATLVGLNLKLNDLQDEQPLS